MKKVLVTGATGFVGANLVRRLIKEKYQLHILKRKKSNIWRIKDIISKLHIHEVDLTEKKHLSRLMVKIRPNFIFHLANLGLYSRIDSPIKNSIETNLLGTVNLIESSEKIDYNCFVNTGSSSEYGVKTIPMKEDDLCQPETNYAISKLAATLFTQAYAKRTKKPLVTLRLFSPFGPFDHPSRFITQTILKMLNSEDILIKNSTAVRDYIFVEDVIEAYVLCMKNPDKLAGQVFNIGSGKQTSIRDVLKLLVKLMNFRGKITYEDKFLDKKNMWQSNIQKANKKLGWQPYMTLGEGLDKTILWFKKNSHFYAE